MYNDEKRRDAELISPKICEVIRYTKQYW